MSYLSRTSRRLTVTALGALGLFALHLGAGALAGGCGATTGQRITLGTRVVAEAGVSAPFVNDYGWSVKLTLARLSVGELYYFSGPPVVAGLSRPPRGSLARNALSIPPAYAHPGHYTEGDALGQMLSPDTVNLLEASSLAGAEAVTGHYESARFSFGSPPQGTLALEMGGRVVWIEGEATKGDVVVRFRASVYVDDVLDSDGNPFVEGCVFEVVDIESTGTVTLMVHPDVWLDQVDFGELPVDPSGGSVELSPGETPHKALVRGLMKGTAYDFSFAPDDSGKE